MSFKQIAVYRCDGCGVEKRVSAGTNPLDWYLLKHTHAPTNALRTASEMNADAEYFCRECVVKMRNALKGITSVVAANAMNAQPLDAYGMVSGATGKVSIR